MLSDEAKKEFKKLDKPIALKILTKLELDLINHSSPRQSGKPLKGELGNLWRYRVGDYRIICEIQDNILTIVIVRIGHRKGVYQ